MNTFTRVLMVLFLASATSMPVLAVPLDDNRFSIYRGDVDRDGVEDLYLEHRDELAVYSVSPVRGYPVPSERAYLLRGLIGGLFSAPVVGRVGKESLTLISGQNDDFDGDGLADLLITDSPGLQVLLTARDGDTPPVLLAQFDQLAGRSVLDNGALTMRDIDGDGFADLEVTWPDQIRVTLLNAATGSWSFRNDPGFETAVTTAATEKFAVVGDSIAAGTHTTEICGNRDVVECLEHLGGTTSPEWSYGSANASWSLASRLGFDPSQVINVADSGERWKDAFEQVQRVAAAGDVSTVLIGLGANDVCRDPGHDYSGDLAVIRAQVDEVLGYLADRMPSDGRIMVSGVPDVVRLRNLMQTVDHNYVFESCQATWDLAGNQVKDGAAKSVCDHFSGHDFCGVVDNTEDFKDFLLRTLLDIWQDVKGVEEGPCGKILSRNASDVDRAEAAAFTLALNSLLAERVRDYNGRNGVEMSFNDRIYHIDLKPEQISRFDCYHPSRVGQKAVADAIWSGMRPGAEITGNAYLDRFDNNDYCGSDAEPWNGCWSESGDDGLPESGDVYVQGGRLRVKDNVRSAARDIDLGDASRAWLSFNWRRKDLDRNKEAVIVELSADGGASWSEATRVRGDGDDYGQQRGYYHQITGFASDSTRLRLRSNALGNNDEVQFDYLKVFAWTEPRAPEQAALRRISAGEDWLPVALGRTLNVPVLLSGPLRDADDRPGLTQLREITNEGFELRVLPAGGAASSATASVPVLALEPGVFMPGDGSLWEVNRADQPGDSAAPPWTTVSFSAPFLNAPHLLLELQNSDGESIVPRARNVTSTGFEFALVDGNGAAVPPDARQLGFLAIEAPVPGDLEFADATRAYSSTTAIITANDPFLLGASLVGRSADGTIEEPLSVDALLLGPELFARDRSAAGAPALLTRLD